MTHGRRGSWAAAIFGWCAVLFCILISSAAVADELDVGAGLTKEQERAVRFCVDFADAVKTNAPDCKAMGSSLEELIDRNEDFVQRIATSDNARVREKCTLALEEAVDGLMVCAESEEVNAALARLAAIEEQSPATASASQQVETTARPELKQLQLLCTDLKKAVIERPSDDCDDIAERLDPITRLHSGLFSRWTENTDVDASEKKLFATAIAECMEAMVSIPERCQKSERVQSVLRRLDE